jgi:hypothetical protein
MRHEVKNPVISRNVVVNRVTSNWLFYTSRAIGTLSCVAKSGLVALKWRGRMGCLLLERKWYCGEEFVGKLKDSVRIGELVGLEDRKFSSLF